MSPPRRDADDALEFRLSVQWMLIDLGTMAAITYLTMFLRSRSTTRLTISALLWLAVMALLGREFSRTYRVNDHGVELRTAFGRRWLRWDRIRGIDRIPGRWGRPGCYRVAADPSEPALIIPDTIDDLDDLIALIRKRAGLTE